MQSETMRPPFKQRKQADNTSHPYDITRGRHRATENRPATRYSVFHSYSTFFLIFSLLSSSFLFYFQLPFPSFVGERGERTRIGISARRKELRSSHSGNIKKNTISAPRVTYDINQPGPLSVPARFGIIFAKGKRRKAFMRGLSVTLSLQQGDADARKRRRRAASGSISQD